MPAPYYYLPPGGKCRQVETEAEANLVELTHAEYAEHDADFKAALDNDLIEPTVRCWRHPDGLKQFHIDKPTIRTDWSEPASNGEIRVAGRPPREPVNPPSTVENDTET